MKALSISDRLGIRRYISQQINYSLLARDAEHELVPAGLDQRTGIMAWSPLQFGLLSGKFRRGQAKPAESRLNSLDAPGTVDEERLYSIVDALAEIAAQRGVSISQVALNWVTRKPGVDTVIIGARNEQQLRDNLAAATWTLTGRRSGTSRRSQRPPAALPLLASAEIRRGSQPAGETRPVTFARLRCRASALPQVASHASEGAPMTQRASLFHDRFGGMSVWKSGA